MDVDVVEPNSTAPGPPEVIAESEVLPTIKTEDVTPQVEPEPEPSSTSIEKSELEIKNEASDLGATDPVEFNPYLLKVTRELNDLGVDTKGIIASPVVAPHLGSTPPLRALGVYEVLSNVASEQINAYKVIERISKHPSLELVRCGLRIDDLPSSPSNGLWRPLIAPPSLLIDTALPNGDLGWGSAFSAPHVPTIETLINVDALGHSDALIEWNQVTLAVKARKVPKKAFGAPLTHDLIWTLPKDDDDFVASRLAARGGTKKRLRDSGAEHTDQDGADDKNAKKKKNLKDESDPNKELVFRFPVQLALAIAQESFTANSVSSPAKQGARTPFPTLWNSKQLASAFSS